MRPVTLLLIVAGGCAGAADSGFESATGEAADSAGVAVPGEPRADELAEPAQAAVPGEPAAAVPAEPAADEPAAPTLIGEVQITPIYSAQFYASPVRSGISVATSRPGGTPGLGELLPSTSVEKLIPSDLYALFAPAKEVPYELLEAERRAHMSRDAQAFAAASEDVAAMPRMSPGSPQALAVGDCNGDAGWFQETQCRPGGWCVLNKTENDFGWDLMNCYTASVSVCAVVGTVTFLREGVRRTVLQGKLETYFKGADCGIFGICDKFNVKVHVIDVDPGELFHWAGHTS